ncbi:MAG: hypothetical protein HYR96_03180 [Deltaproteobacteria bacterium]|nr:hypothetical protein [Deltaproteobacteria bacterium]MBI3294314.1 hypothetical protein [Deltaproteobacteria bacterium]
MKKGAGFLFMVLSTLVFAETGTIAERGVGESVKIFQAIVSNSVRTEAAALKEFGAEGVALFNAVKSMRIAGNAGNLGSVNYNQLAQELNDRGVTSAAWVRHIEQLAGAKKVIAMSDLVTNSPLPQPRVDQLAVLERHGGFNRFRTPGNDTDRALQPAIARLLDAAERGAQLCDNKTECLSANVATVNRLNDLGLTARGLTVDFAVDAFTGFLSEPTPYTGRRLNTISRNFLAAVRGASSADAINPAGVRSCILTGKPSLN